MAATGPPGAPTLPGHCHQASGHQPWRSRAEPNTACVCVRDVCACAVLGPVGFTDGLCLLLGTATRQKSPQSPRQSRRGREGI